METKNLLTGTALDFTVRTEKLKTSSTGLITDKIAIIRNDNDAILGVHGEKYTPFQNHDLLELLEVINKNVGLQLHKTGTFDDGGKIYLQLKSNDLILGNDKIEGYITGINSFDGTTSLAFGNTNVTISCRNTFHAGYRELETKLKHSLNLKIRIDTILRDMDTLLKEEGILFENIKKLSQAPVEQKMIDILKNSFFDIPKNTELSTRKNNLIEKFEQELNTEFNDKGKTLWGLFSGLTRYTTHSALSDKDKNEFNKMFGNVGKKERTVFNQLVDSVA